MLIIVKYLLAKISDAFWCALNAQFFDQFSCRRDFLSGKFAVKANLEIASRLEFAVQCCQALGGVLHVMQHPAALNHVVDVLKLIGIQEGCPVAGAEHCACWSPELFLLRRPGCWC